MSIEESHILIALVTYLVATASPGPAILSIMALAMNRGRNSALLFASGVLLGSLIWALLALLGVAVLISTHAILLYILKILGGLYLLWLSYKSVKIIYSKENLSEKITTVSDKKLFFQGVALHVTNPKAIFTWVAIVSLALPQTPSFIMSLNVIIACMLLGVLVFGGYAVLFSTCVAQNLYKKFGNWFSGILALVFGVAGVKLLLSNH